MAVTGAVEAATEQTSRAGDTAVAIVAGGDGDDVDDDTTKRAYSAVEAIGDAVGTLLVSLRLRGPRSSCTAARCTDRAT